jgi:hypothetical protein
MSEAVETYKPTVNLLELFLNPAGDLKELSKDTKQNTYRFPGKYKTRLAYDLINVIEQDDSLFQLQQFCYKKGITTDELEAMANDNVTLRRALMFAKETFESRLVSMGFTSQKATMAIFALKNQHGYRDRQSSDDNRQSIVVNLHLPSRDGAVMAKYEVIESSSPKKGKVRGKKSPAAGRIALEAKAEIETETAVEVK